MAAVTPFVLETNGFCFLCLKRPKRSEGGDVINVSRPPPRPVSFGRMCHYLRMNFEKILRNSMCGFGSEEDLRVELARSELMGSTCEECEKVVKELSDISQEVEVLQMMLDECVKTIHKRMVEVNRKEDVMEGYKTHMMSMPKTIIHFGIVDELRKETLERCSAKMDEMMPCVLLQRLEPAVNDGATVDMRPRSPSLVISSVEGSYKTRSEGNHSAETSLCGEGDSFRKSLTGSSPGSLVYMEIEEAEEDNDSVPVIESITVVEEPLVSNHPLVISLAECEPSKQFKCDQCPKAFGMARHLESHKNAVHLGKTFKCDECPRTFNYKCNLVTHKRRHHKGKSRMGIPTATFVPTPENLIFPTTSKPETCSSLYLKSRKGFRCKLCDRAFTALHTLEEHHQAVHLGLQFQCHLCTNGFAWRAGWRRHLRDFHKLPTEEHPRPNILRKMNTPTVSRYPNIILRPALNVPVPSATVTSEEIKPQTSTTTTVSNDEHQLPRKENFECTTCNKVFNFRSQLDDHRYTVHEGKKWACLICAKEFSTRSTLNRHKRKDHLIIGRNRRSSIEASTVNPHGAEGVGNFSKIVIQTSEVIDVEDAGDSPFVDERETEVDENPWSPSPPSVDYYGPGEPPLQPNEISVEVVEPEPMRISAPKKKRRKRTRKELANAFDPNKPIKCKLCPKTFTRLRDLRHHHTITHFSNVVQRKYECQICHKKFMNQSYLSRHRQSVHLGQRFPCGLCQSTFSQRGSLNLHAKICPGRKALNQLLE